LAAAWLAVASMVVAESADRAVVASVVALRKQW
jgi:hypothetical protein